MVNKTTIESMAVNAVREKLNYTGYIDASYIKEGDKEPVWDGNIYVYNSKESHSIEKLVHKVPLQIKGNTTGEIEKRSKYRIAIRDLKLYLNDGGVLYFVVSIDIIRKICKVYYISLLPYNLKKAIMNVENNKSIEFDVLPLPDNDDEVTKVICDFAQHRQMQRSFTNFKEPRVLNFKEVSIPVTRIGNNFSIDEFLLNYGGYCYGHDNDGALYPLRIEKGSVVRTEERQDKVTVGDKEFFSSLIRKKSITQDVLILNDNLELVCTNSLTGVCNIRYNGGLSKCIESVEFIVEVGKKGEFCINGLPKKIIINEKDVSILEKNLEFLYKLRDALHKSNVHTDLQLAPFTYNDKLNINILIWAIGEGNEIELDTDLEITPYRIEINNQNILCIAERQSNGKYKISPFSTRFDLSNCKLKVSPYVNLGKIFLENVININLMDILPDIQKYGTDYDHLGAANSVGLKLLSIYDDTKDEKLLEVAFSIFEWVEGIASGEAGILYHLNILQCQYRKNGFISDIDKEYLHDIIEDDYGALVKYGAYVLLEDLFGADKQFKKISTKEQQAIKEYPIYNLHKKLRN